MNINLKQLEAFVWVCDLGSFNKAADRLNTTQPNISARISSLENVLDVLLMERDAGSVRLTSKGKHLLEHARKVLSETDNFILAANRAALFDGVLRLGITEMIVHTWLRDFLKVFKQRFPNITVELTVDLSANLEKELYERSIDLAFQNEPFSRQVSGNVELGVYPLIWIASPKINLHRKRKVSFQHLANYPILTHSRGSRPYKEVAEHFSSRRDSPVRLVPSSNLAACVHMAIDGFGSATVPEAMVKNEIKTGELKKISYSWTPQSLKFFARYDAEKSAQFVARASEIASEVSHLYTQCKPVKRKTKKH